jgi:type I restriction-modification system DNA methylase subunit
MSAGNELVDWEAELSTVLEYSSFRSPSLGMSLPIARAMTKVFDIAPSGDCACAFPQSASIAWALSETRPVRFYAGDPDVARLFAMFAAGAERPLFVDRRNPLDGSFMPVIPDIESRDRSPVEEVDYIVSAPPFGFRVRDRDGAKFPVEGYQAERLRRFARKEFLSIVPDGLLFRDGRNDVALRRRMVEENDVEVDSLPPGLFGRSTGISTSLLRLRPGAGSNVHFVDGRSMSSQSTGRVQEKLLVQHLDRWPDIIADDVRSIDVPVTKVAENNFALVPDRYIQPRSLQAVEQAAAEMPQVSILDVARIERGKAPRPIHDAGGDVALVCLELAPADLQDGIARRPKRQVGFPPEEVDRARNVAVRAGDILVSIKGNVGAVGIVPSAAPDPEGDEPWIISQSLAIIRYRPNPHLPSPDVLNAILTAPWVRRNLERLASGSTVKSLSMSDLRQLRIPLLPQADLDEAQVVVDDIAERRKRLETELAQIDEHQRVLWTKLWGLNPADQEESLYAQP